MHVYVHVPFCASKCRYCAFHSRAGASDRDFRDFVRLLPREIALRRSSGGASSRSLDTLDTLYVGGGTPSLLGPDRVFALLDGVLRLYPLRAPGAEVTVEANPADVTPALAAALAAAGVSRVSIGAQSFSERTLRWLGRRHGAAETREAVATLRAAGVPRISLDLIAAVPGEPRDSFAESLREAVALEPDHVSVYPLSIEPGTPLAREGVRPPADEESLAAVSLAEDYLGARGYARYELSNYARPGAECRHNRAVWLGEDYAGFGPAAHSRDGLERRANVPDFAAWRAALETGSAPPAAVESVSPEEDETERFLTRVRLARWSLPNPESPAGRRRAAVLAGLEREGIVRHASPSGGAADDSGTAAEPLWALTARGREVADSVMSALV